MFILQLTDRLGNNLNIGDIVKISDGKKFNFYAEIKYLEESKVLTPFHTFSFSSFELVNQVPENAIQSSEERYKVWYLPPSDAAIDEYGKEFEEFLMSWRQCEHLLTRCFKIELM